MALDFTIPYHTLSREERALNQRIFVMNRCALNFDVSGTSNDLYHVNLDNSTSSMRCTCRDFSHNSNNGELPCKHIIYVYRRILCIPRENIMWTKCVLEPSQVISLLQHAEHDDRVITSRIQYILDATEIKYKFAKIRNDKKLNAEQLELINKHDDACAVCYETFDVDNHTESIWICCLCGHNLHTQCWKQWSKYHHTCPFCRCKN